MIEVRRPSDGELCGYIEDVDGGWRALTVFGGELGTHDDRAAATAHVIEGGLASLAERWSFRPDESSEWQVVCIQEATAGSVRLALGYCSMPGVPTRTVTRQELLDGASLVLGLR